ncbi:hypothetical protein LTR35_018320, partial [Friedmanniomyces endolithicus]
MSKTWLNATFLWLSIPENARWLLVFDNVDRDWQPDARDAQAYNYKNLLPFANHVPDYGN